MRHIHDVLDIAYGKYTMMQHPSEFYKFSEFYEELKCENVLEIGSYLGGTFYVLCKLSKLSGLKISIDFPFYDSQLDMIQKYNTYEKMKTFADDVHILTADSHKDETKQSLITLLNGKKFDFIFIDGDHTYDGVKQDFEMYSPLLKSGGHIAFHDINDTDWHRQCNTYVSKFWNELPNDNKIEFNSKSFCMGIGVIKLI